MLTDADDRRHRLNPGPLARESLIFLLFLPEENLGMIAYTWVDGESVAGSMVTVFGQDDERLVHHVVQGVEMDRAADFTDWQVGPLRVRHGEPHKHAHVTFEHEGVSLDYRFEAINEAFSYHDNRDGCPGFLADDRLEQCGLVTGTLTIGDRRIEFDTTGHRDHSWGTRDWTAFHHYKWVNVQAGSDVAVNFMHGLAMDRQYELGYVHRDGEQSPVVSIEAHVERDDEYYAYTSARFVVTDEKGRVTEIETGNRTSLIVWSAGGLVSRDAASTCTVAGLPGIVHVEEGWVPDFVEHRLKSAAARKLEQTAIGE
ncbi:hypothetical protein [Pseudonocardia sp. H11422]|uniref:DUF7064 domain-containing protein n=1 Tax=Pseudonocardia sp. H11422 TaxID=2835866 RepID=UPI001BDCC9D3|nr:hypothetical protein [Pseudonocardia sp. H11422]